MLVYYLILHIATWIILYYIYVLKKPMSNISYYIKKIYNINNQSIPSNIFLNRAKNDLMFFYTKVHVDNKLLENDSCVSTLLVNYIKAKKTKNAFNRLCYLYKLKKAKKSVKYDLFFNDLSIIKPHQQIELYLNNTIYYFRLSDIVSIWVGCLSKCENMFCSPIKIKNPYTNIEFSTYDLYNIYISLIHSNFHIPKLIMLFFEAEFDLNKFTYDNYTILKDIAIDDFMENGSIYEKFENILNMMHEYREYLNYIVIRTPFTFREKSNIVKRLSPFLKNYLHGEYSCHPLKKKRCKNKAKRGLKRFFEENDDIPFYRERPIRLSNWDVDSDLSSRISRILTRSNQELNVPNMSSMPPPLSLSSSVLNSANANATANANTDTPRNLNISIREASASSTSTSTSTSNDVPSTTLPTIQTNTNASASTNLSYRNGSIFNSNSNSNNRAERDPFTPSFTLIRSPTRRNNANQSGFNMRMFNR